MRLTAIRTLVVLAVVQTTVQGQTPQPAPEYKRLAYFAGSWSFSGTAKDGPMGPGGPITMKQTCDIMDGGFAVVCRAEGKSPMGATKGASITSYDTDKKAYTYTSAESNMPVFTALGTVKGPTWTWNTDGMMGTQRVYTRVTLTEGGPKAYDFAMEISMDGKSFARLVEGKFTKS